MISSLTQTMLLFSMSTFNVISFNSDIMKAAGGEHILGFANEMHQNLKRVSIYEFLGFSRNYLAFFFTLVYILVLQTFSCAVIEKLMKENWVIRETAEKSFRTFFTMIENSPRETFVVDNQMNLLYINKKFDRTVLNICQKRNPRHMKDFIGEDHLLTFKEKILSSIKSNKECSKVIKLNSTDSFDSLIQPINYKGKKAALITLKNYQDEKVKNVS